jgi:N,N'-diacetyllegionaminate synthase
MKSPFEGKHGPLLIAEIGGNHEGNFEYAKKLAASAIEADVDFVKFQIYSGDSLVSKVESPERNQHFKKFELTKKQHIYLASMVQEAGIGYTASVWDLEALNWIDPYISLYKIGSGDLTAYPILNEIVNKDKPIILSTGLSTEEEVLSSVKYIQSINKRYKSEDYLALLQCTSMYPIDEKDANISVIQRLKELTNLTVGYSDHTEGIKTIYYAVSIGAQIIEFHFTDSREGKIFRDHKVSLTLKEVKDLIDEINVIKLIMGNSIKKPLEIELENDHVKSFRRAVYPSRDIAAGEVLTKDNLTVLRPNCGIDARDYNTLIGKTIKSSVKYHQKLEWTLINDL